MVYEGQRTVTSDDCYIQFLKSNRYLTIATAVAAFYLPVIILCMVYYRIYRETRRHQRNLYELQAFRVLQPRSDSKTTSRRARGNSAGETGSTSCLAGCRKRLSSSNVRRRWRCRPFAKCSGSDEVERSFRRQDHDQGDPTSRKTSICQSQSVQTEIVQTLVSSPSDLVTSPADQPSTSSALSPGQCQCSWHGEGRCQERVDLPQSSRQPVFVLTVEFAGDSIEDITTADNEELQNSCLSTEKPSQTSQTSLRFVELQISSRRYLSIRRPTNPV